jgi:SMC interacting uncharacterized protein involved in chromosome segregation
MDLQTVFNIVLGIVLALIGWFARVMWEAVKELRADLSRLREEIPKEYVSKSDWKDSVREVMELLREINNKLDRKADK